MLARLQQVISLAWLGALALWAWWVAAAGFGAAALALLVLIVFGHAAVLALEFLLVRHVNRADPAPHAGAGQLLLAWVAESLAAPRVFLWRQPWRSRTPADHLPADAQGRTGVLFIHGFVCNRGLWRPWLRRLQRRGVPFVAIDLEPVFGSIDAYAPTIEAAVRRLRAATGRPPVVVAHSMGGLALRRWRAAEPGNAARLAAVLTLGTPHHGTWLARWAFSANGRQMRRGGPWLAALQALEAARGAADHRGFTCFYSHCDNIVFPASTATLAGARQVHLAGTPHVHMADHPAPWAELCRQLGIEA